MMEMFDPAHPGEIIREDCLKPLGLTVTAAADALGVTR
jgi:antitoxin HigA-1